MTAGPQLTVGRAFLGLFSPEQTEKIVCFEGPRGTGKTRAILTALVSRALAYPGCRILLARSTRVRLTETVLVTLEQQVLPAFGLAVPGGAGRGNRTEYELPGGSVLIPMGLDDPNRTTSAEFFCIYLAEAVEVATRELAEAVSGSLRQGGMPYHQLILDCNPSAPGHWLNRAMEPVENGLRAVDSVADYKRVLAHNSRPADGGWKRVLTGHRDNPAYFDVSAWEYTKEGLAYLETLGNLSGHLRRRWLRGEWVSAEGSVFPEFSESEHVVDGLEVPEDWPMYVGYDPGYDHPSAVLWVAVAPNGCLYVVDEIYRGGLGVDQLSEMIHAKNEGRTIRKYFGDPQYIFSRTAASPRSIQEQFRKSKHPITFYGWPRTGTGALQMVEDVRTSLVKKRLKVCRHCVETIREFQSWSYKRNSAGLQLNGDDAFVDADNHAMDVVKGLVALRLEKLSRGGVLVYQTAPAKERFPLGGPGDRITRLWNG